MILVAIILFSGLAVILLSCIGFLTMQTVYARLHFLTAASTLGAFLVTLAVLISEGFNQQGIKSILTFAFLLFISPVLTHETARITKFRQEEKEK